MYLCLNQLTVLPCWIMIIPEHMPPILAIGDRMEAKVNLGLHYLLDISILDRAELLLGSLFLVNAALVSSS